MRRIVDRSGSTFLWPMRLLPRERRQAIFAVYALARVLDDIADGDSPAVAKGRRLDAWRGELDAIYAGAPRTRIGVALAPAVAAFGLERQWFDALVDGMAMDADGPIVAPPLADLDRYCQRVAGTVGRLCVAIFGRPDEPAQAFAEALGRALQLTNILRDLKEDAALGRLYLPRELLAQAGVRFALARPEAVLDRPGFADACAALADLAEAAFAEAKAHAAVGGRRGLAAGLRMMALYRLRLEGLRARGFAELGPVRLRRRDKLRALLLPSLVG